MRKKARKKEHFSRIRIQKSYNLALTFDRKELISKIKQPASNILYSIMLSYTKKTCDDGWRNAYALFDEFKNTEDYSKLAININRDEMIKILMEDPRFEYAQRGGCIFRLKEYKNLRTIKSGSQILSNHGPVESSLVDDLSQSFLEEYERFIRNPKSWTGDTSAGLGLDFGTSFTKAAFIESINNKGLIPFGNQQMKASVVYTNDDFSELSINLRQETPKQIRYFKATISPVPDYQILMSTDTKSIKDASFVCSVFFVANILRYLKLKLSDYLRKNAELQVNMGMPTLYNKAVATVYRKVLHTALYISEKNCDIRIVPTDTLRKWINLAEQDFSEDSYNPESDFCYHSTFPELFAETLYLLRRKSFGPGFYNIIDIGGGTTDFMFLQKTLIEEKKSQFTCYQAAVQPLGNEIRKIYDNDDFRISFVSAYRQILIESKNSAMNYNNCVPKVETILLGGGKLDGKDYFEKLIKANALDPIQYNLKTDIIDFGRIDKLDFIQKDHLAANQGEIPYFRFVTAYVLAEKAGDGNDRLQMLQVMQSTKPIQLKDARIERNKENAGYNDIN